MHLKTASNIAVTMAAIAITVLAVTEIYHGFSSPQTTASEASLPSFAQRYIGKQQPLAGLEKGASGTILLFTSKVCHFCAQSVPFYRRLASARSMSAGRLRLVAAVPQAIETGADAKSWFAERQIAVDQAQAAPFRLIGVTGTPTLALVGPTGTVTDAWTGLLSPDREAEVLKRLAALCAGCFTAGSL